MNKSQEFARKIPGYLKSSWKHGSFIYIFVVMFVVYCCINTRINWGSIMNIFTHTAVVGTMAIGMGLIIISGDIDLSVGSSFAFSGGLAMLTYNAMVQSGVSAGVAFAVCIVITILIGAAVGFINGFMVGKMKIPAFIATLGTMLIFRSLCKFTLKEIPTSSGSGQQQTYQVFDYANSPYYQLGNTKIPGIEVPIVAILLIVFIIAAWLFVKYTKFGRKIYALGSNQKAASLAGINVPWTKTIIFTVAGGLVGLAAVLHTSIYGSMDSSTAGLSYELYAIASCIIGGIAMTGGKGNIIGILFGALAFQIVDKIISVLVLNPLINDTIKGAILLLAVMLQLIQGSTLAEMGARIKSWFMPKKVKLAGEAQETEDTVADPYADEKIEKLNSLKKEGLITEEEYNEEISKLK